MLYGYKKISIIYGGVGSYYAGKIEERLNKLHNEEHYPIKTMCINSDWVSNTILSDVISAIKDSDLIYVVFTLDDIGCRKSDFIEQGKVALNDRLRQNVLIELGVALAVTDMDINKIKVVANFEKSELGDDFPSDIRDALNIKTFSNDTFEDILNSVESFAKNSFSRESTIGILKKNDEIFDFENVFDEYEKYEYIPSMRIKKLKDILDLWLKTVAELDFIDEKFAFCLERLKSFPIFGNGTKLCDWIRNFRKHIVVGDTQNVAERKFLRMVKTVIDLCLDYTVIKSDEKTENEISEYKLVANEFKDVYADVKAYLNDGRRINPLILFCLYEYYGLTEMRIYKGDTKSDINAKLEHINKIISLYGEGVGIANEVDSDFQNYTGYITFNLGRAYFYKYELTRASEDKDLFVRFMEKTLKVRKNWKESTQLPQCYINALSYEYFYAKSEYIKMLYKIEELNKEDLILSVNQIIEGIDGYISRDEELMKLCKIKNVCINMKTAL